MTIKEADKVIAAVEVLQKFCKKYEVELNVNTEAHLGIWSVLGGADLTIDDIKASEIPNAAQLLVMARKCGWRAP